MPPQLEAKLNVEQVRELEKVRDSHPKAYLRERASAILKVANGQSARQVGEHGLLKRHEPETVSLWVKRYLAEGLKGLTVKSGLASSPAFSPKGKVSRPS
jgi:hypothetical protein